MLDGSRAPRARLLFHEPGNHRVPGFVRQQSMLLTWPAPMQLAKKQRTWFQRDRAIRWLDPENPLPEARELVAGALNA